MSEQVHVVAILSPKPDKADRLQSLLTSLCATVHEKEPYTLRYLLTTGHPLNIPSPSTTTPDIIMIETYESKEANDKHVTEPHFLELFKAIEEEGLLAKEMMLWKTGARAGFDLGRVLVGS